MNDITNSDFPDHTSWHIKRRSFIAGTAGLAASIGIGAGSFLNSPRAEALTLTFVDDFTGAAGSKPNPRVWAARQGSTGYFPSAVYLDSAATAFVDGNSNLVLRAMKCTAPPPWWPSAQYQAAWLTTKASFSSGINSVWEARIKFDPTKGVWPCFWLMGVNKDWPECGEVDIIELFSTLGAGSTVHAPIPGKRDTIKAQKNVAFDDQWHTWRLQWDDSGFKFWQDYTYGKAPYFTVATDSLDNWPFSDSNPLYIILNTNVVGDLDAAKLPCDMLVDWVRVGRI